MSAIPAVSKLHESSPSHEQDPFGANSHWTPLSAVVFFLCFFINGVDGANVLLMSYLAPYVSKDWNLNPTMLGVIFSSLLVGMAIGGLLVAPQADRHGRRKLVLIALLFMSAGMIFTALSKSLVLFALSRLIVGVGLGTVLACMSALVSEFAPASSRNGAVGLMQAGYPIGATISGFATVWAIAHYSWRAVILAAGFGTFVFFPLALILLPESVAFLAYAQPVNALAEINRIRRRLVAVSLDALPPKRDHEQKSSVVLKLLEPELRRSTILLWIAIFCAFMVLYAIISWIPRLAIEAGLDPRSGIIAGSIYNVGAFVGTFAISFLSRNFGIRQLVATFLISSAACLVFFGGVPMGVKLVLVTAFAIGVTLQGGFNGLYPLTTCIYPVQLRSSGLGWAMGIGRAGAIIGPLLAGWLLTMHVKLVVLFIVLATPAIIAAVSSLAIQNLNE